MNCKAGDLAIVIGSSLNVGLIVDCIAVAENVPSVDPVWLVRILGNAKALGHVDSFGFFTTFEPPKHIPAGTLMLFKDRKLRPLRDGPTFPGATRDRPVDAPVTKQPEVEVLT